MAVDTFVSHRLRELADREFDSVKRWMGGLRPTDCNGFLVEACRALDYLHVVQFLSRDPKDKMPHPDFETIVAGWNPFLSLVLPHCGGFHGFPLAESTQNSLSRAMGVLHQLGRGGLLRQAAALIRHGMAVGEVISDRIVIRASERISSDYFLDQLDAYKLADWYGDKAEPSEQSEAGLEARDIEDIDSRIAALVFAWKTNKGTMVGYRADPDIDRYFLELVSRNTLDWRNEAGIHPDAKIADVCGSDIAAVGLLLASFYLKHIYFVEIGRRTIPDVNLPMSLTIWKDKIELAESVADFTGMQGAAVSVAINLFTLRHHQYAYFLSEPTPFIPMLIEVSKEYVLSPVSSIFRNPFHGMRMMDEWASNGPASSVRARREDWMRSELYHLFLGNRYHLVGGSTRLRRAGATVTDIDAAFLDWTTGELALFHLKWQDFNTSDIGVRRSKARNFVRRVDEWAKEVGAWINEFGVEALCRVLRLNSEGSRRVASVRLFAIGRSASRFRSYGVVPDREEVAACSWPLFVRLRHEIGPVENVVRALHEQIKSESTRRIEVRSVPHEIVVAGQGVLFESLWNVHGEEGA